VSINPTIKTASGQVRCNNEMARATKERGDVTLSCVGATMVGALVLTSTNKMPPSNDAPPVPARAHRATICEAMIFYTVGKDYFTPPTRGAGLEIDGAAAPAAWRSSPPCGGPRRELAGGDIAAP
jgi:hypothetical protein